MAAEPLRAESSAHLLALIGSLLDGMEARWRVIGALAVAYHGWVRASMDADALITLKGSIDRELLSNLCHRMGHGVEARCRRLLGA